jgi:hypothetical protein
MTTDMNREVSATEREDAAIAQFVFATTEFAHRMGWAIVLGVAPEDHCQNKTRPAPGTLDGCCTCCVNMLGALVRFAKESQT